MGEEKYELELLFQDAQGKNARILIKDPKLNLKQDAVQPVMKAIEDANIFEADGVDLYAQAKSARYITRRVDAIFTAEA